MNRTTWIPFVLALLVAAPALAQDPPPPPDAPHAPHGPGHERLQRIRHERMRSALGLTQEQASALHAAGERHREEMRSALEAHRGAMERLHDALEAEPVDQGAVSSALEALEARRATMHSLHERHREEIERSLTPEQRGRMLLFNRQFDARLRELMARHREHGAVGRPGAPGRRGGPGARRPRRMEGPARRGAEAPGDLPRRVADLERRVGELEEKVD